MHAPTSAAAAAAAAAAAYVLYGYVQVDPAVHVCHSDGNIRDTVHWPGTTMAAPDAEYG